jgi:hypothetical protein
VTGRAVLGHAVAIGYLGVVAALTADAFRPGDHGFTTTEAVAALITLPAVIVALPVIYLVGALAWAVSDTDGSGPTLLVMMTFTVMMTGVAGANVALAYWLWRLTRARRAP